MYVTLGGEFSGSLAPCGEGWDSRSSEKGPKEVTAGLRERVRGLEDSVGLKKGESSGCVKMALRKVPLA